MDTIGLEPSGETPGRLDLRIVLLGANRTGKSSAANSILGRQEFDTLRRTAVCVKRQGTVAGLEVTVVDTPGWPAQVTLEESLRQTQREIQFSVSLCPPGPHVFLLAIQANTTFTETHRNAIQLHLELLGERVWRRTVVLFTHGDRLRNTTVEQCIKSSGEALQGLLERCGNRYQVLNCLNDDRSQITELLEKIEDTVAFNRACHYEVDSKRLQEITEQREKEERRAGERQIRLNKQHLTLHYVIGEVHHLSELRIVLLGYKRAFKSSSGNMILERQAFDTEKRTALCVKREGTVAGKRVIIVDTPGWRNCDPLTESPELTKREILHGVCLCRPGPHAFLLAVRLDVSFTEDSRTSVQQHLEHLSKSVWNHTILLFTYGEYLGDTTVEQYIESEGENLQWLVEMCGNRYLVTDCENSVNGTPGAMLVEKIEAMLAANNGCHYEMDEERLEEIEERKKQQDEKAYTRMIVQKERDTLRSQLGETYSPELRIVLLGSKYAGKSSSGNCILGQQEFGTTGPTAMCVKRQGLPAARVVTVVDTPGWGADHSLDQSDEVTTHQIALSLSLCPPGPHAILLAVRLTTAFTAARRSAVQQHLERIDSLIWSHSIVLFTYGDFIGDVTIEQYIESEGEPLQWLVEKCGNRYHVFNNDDKGDRAQVIELLEKVEEMLAGHSGSCYHIPDTLCDEMLRGEEEGKSRERLIEKQRRRELPVMHATGYSHLWRFLERRKTKKPLIFFSKERNVNENDAQRGPQIKDQGSADRNDTGITRVLHEATEDSTVSRFSHSEINRGDLISLNSSGYGGSRKSSRTSLSIENISMSGSLHISDGETHNQCGQSCCKSCADITDSSHWVLMEPSVSTETGFPVYKHSTPSGSFECVVSGLRWVCGREVTVQYHFTDPGVYRAELAMLQYVPIGPLMDIKVLSGELLEAHLPHFACLEGSDSSLREAVRVLRGVDSSISLETCELTRFHAKLLKPSFSLIEVLVKMGVPMKTHLDVLIYRTRVTPLTLLTYVVPRDASMIQAVEEEILEIQDAKRIKKHRPHRSIWMNSKFSLTSSCPADVSPSKITLTYIRPPDLFEVFMENVEDCFELEVISQGQSIWKVTMRSIEFGETRGVSGNSGEVMHKEKKSDRDRNNRGEGNISSMSNKDRLFMFRPDLIKRMSGGLLRDVLDRLQAQPCVVSRREAEEVLQRTSVLQDQVTFLVDVVLKKGDGASGILLSLLEELDNYLYLDLGLCEEATYL